MIKNTLLAVVLTLCTVTLFAGKGGRRSPKKPGSPTSLTFPSKSELELKIHDLKEALDSRSLSPDKVIAKNSELAQLRKRWKALSH